jgi:hypothetical protein
MTVKKLLTLMVVPLLAIAMAACETDRADDDVWTEEGQLPTFEDPAFQDPAYQDTVVIPDAHPEPPQQEVIEEEETAYPPPDGGY